MEQLLLQGIQHHMAGRLQEAEICYQQFLQLSPQNGKALNALGMLLLQKGNLQQAYAYLQKAIYEEPANPAFHTNIAKVCWEMGETQTALTHLNCAVTWDPLLVDAYFTRANLYFNLYRYKEAMNDYQQVLQLTPNFAEGHHNLAFALQTMGKLEEAIAHYYRSQDLKPGNKQLYLNLGKCFELLKQYDKAIACYEESIALDPYNLAPYSIIIHILLTQGRLLEAKSWAERACLANPQNKLLHLIADTLVPAFSEDTKAIAQQRADVEAALDRYLEHPFEINLAELTVCDCRPSYYLVYQGQNNVAIRSKFADFFIQNCRFEIETSLPHIPATSVIEKPLPKIGVFVNAHPDVFCKILVGLLNRLSPHKFHITIICPPVFSAYIAPWVTASYIDFLLIENDILQNAALIKAAQFNALYFFEVGTDLANYLMPFFRLAPIQFTSWGMPETSGIPDMDYYLSSDLLELPEAQQHYRERLVRFKSLLAYYFKPQAPNLLKTRENYALPPNKHLYGCLQNPFKIHPDFDPMLADILAQDPKGIIVFVERTDHAICQKIMARLETLVPDAANRILFLPWMSEADYFNLLTLMDVLLDTLYFNGGITTYDALAFGLPIVTLPTQLLCGRMTAACYQKMGVLDCIVSTPKAYAKQAVRIATQPKYRQKLQVKILAANHVLYEDPETVTEFEAFLDDILTA